MHISPDIEKQISSKVETYGSVEKVLVAALEALENQEQFEYERQAVLEGINSGKSIPAEQVFTELREKFSGQSLDALR